MTTSSNQPWSEFTSRKYQPFPAVGLSDRTWPETSIIKAPIWCSVDLRDGNQALISPMDHERKLALFNELLRMGYREIEVGFPAASQTDFDFVRYIIEQDLIPEGVAIQVLTQAREHLIERTIESVRGCKHAIIHVYNSTSTLQRKVVFQADMPEIKKIATDGTQFIVSLLEKESSDTKYSLEYSPESFTGTELPFAADVCNAVLDIWQPDEERLAIINLPATVEMSSPNLYADQIEWMHRHLAYRNHILLSLHPHNDRGTAVAATELGLQAGADRVEGTLFGNGERTGNVDLVTLGLNMLTQGIDPNIDFSDISQTVRVAESSNQLPVPARHPYAGDLVFTAFSGSHQDAIKKGFAALEKSNDPIWQVPYLPIDPRDLGRTYEAIIRVNSQSGKGGVAWVMEKDHGLSLPRGMQVEFSQCIQKLAEKTSDEISSQQVLDNFRAEYLNIQQPLAWKYANVETRKGEDNETLYTVELALLHQGETLHNQAESNGPVAASVKALNELFDINIEVLDFHQSSTKAGNDAEAACFIQVVDTSSPSIVSTWGAAVHQNTLHASVLALYSAINRLCAQQGLKLNVVA